MLTFLFFHIFLIFITSTVCLNPYNLSLSILPLNQVTGEHLEQCSTNNPSLKAFTYVKFNEGEQPQYWAYYMLNGYYEEEELLPAEFKTVVFGLEFDNIIYVCPGDYGRYHLHRTGQGAWLELTKGDDYGDKKWYLQCQFFMGEVSGYSKGFFILVGYIGQTFIQAFNILERAYFSVSIDIGMPLCYFRAGDPQCIFDKEYCGLMIVQESKTLMLYEVYLTPRNTGISYNK